MKKQLGVGAALVVVALAACGGGASHQAAHSTAGQATSAATSAPTDLHALGQEYLAAAAPANAAGETFVTKAKALPSSATGADLAAIAAPFTDALTTFDSAVLRLAFPASMQTDVRALVTADAALIGDLRGAVGLTVFTVSTWEQQTAGDVSKAGAASNVVRADLGLPPPST